jgi:hypothetical protein
MTGDPPTDAELDAIVNGLRGSTPEATERAQARLRAQLQDARRPALERYRSDVAALGPDHRFGRRLAFANIAVVVASLAVIFIPLTINAFARISGGGTVLDPDCLVDHTRRYCLLRATRDAGPVDLPGLVLLPFALASAVLTVLVWPSKRHYFVVKPSRPIVLIGAIPAWFGMFSLMLGAFAGLFTWGFTPDWGVWLAEFLPAVTIWTIVGVVGIAAGILMRDRRPARRGRSARSVK